MCNPSSLPERPHMLRIAINLGRAGQRRPLTLSPTRRAPYWTEPPVRLVGLLQPRDMESINIRRDRALQQPQERKKKGKCPTERERERERERKQKKKEERRRKTQAETSEEKEGKIQQDSWKKNERSATSWHWNKKGGGVRRRRIAAISTHHVDDLSQSQSKCYV